jgi:hypothetical protein
MSCLLAACIPALLMLSTFGLQRLESVLHGNRPSAAEIIARFDHSAKAAHETATARETVRRSGLGARIEPVYRLLADEPGLPTLPFATAPPNPQFRPAGHVNPV